MKSAGKNTEPQFYSTAAWQRPHSTPSGLGSNCTGSLVKAPPLTNAASIVTLLRPLVPTEGLRFCRVIMPLMPCQQQQQQKIYKKTKKNQNKLAPAWLPRLHNTINTIKIHFYSAHFPVKCQLISRDKGFTVTVDILLRIHHHVAQKTLFPLFHSSTQITIFIFKIFWLEETYRSPLFFRSLTTSGVARSYFALNSSRASIQQRARRKRLSVGGKTRKAVGRIFCVTFKASNRH